MITAALQSAPPTFKAELMVPEGYRAVSAMVSYLVQRRALRGRGLPGGVTFATTPVAAIVAAVAAVVATAAATPPVAARSPARRSRP